MLCKLRVRVIGRPPRPAEGLDAEKCLEAKRGQRQIAPEKAAVEGVQADGAIALRPQKPHERSDRRAREGVVRIEAVVAELGFRDPGQHRKLGPHRIGAPAGNLEATEGPAVYTTSVET